MRALRLVLGIAIIVQGIQTSAWLFVVIGVIFTLMPLLNIGCSSSSGCHVPTSKTTKNKEEISYDEIC